MSATSSWRRSAATQPTSPSPMSTGRRGNSLMPPATARISRRFAAASTTHTATAGTCMSSTAAFAMPARTSSGSSEEDTSWLSRASVCRRVARRLSASCSRALRSSTPACSPMAWSVASSASAKRWRAVHHTR